MVAPTGWVGCARRNCLIVVKPDEGMNHNQGAAGGLDNPIRAGPHTDGAAEASTSQVADASGGRGRGRGGSKVGVQIIAWPCVECTA